LGDLASRWMDVGCRPEVRELIGALLLRLL
jgi:hypothetical protein